MLNDHFNIFFSTIPCLWNSKKGFYQYVDIEYFHTLYILLYKAALYLQGGPKNVIKVQGTETWIRSFKISNIFEISLI